jgi:hypothetical protein
MAYTPEKILSLLPLLDEQIADDFENETLDFKECPTEAKLRELAKEMAVASATPPVELLYLVSRNGFADATRRLWVLTLRLIWKR